jgi:hypothetical protein
MKASRTLLPPLLSAGLLYLLLHAFNVVAMVVIPHLLELGETAPRLAALGWLGLFCSPVAFVAIVHRVARGALDRLDASGTDEGRGARATSLWAGLFAWFAMLFASMVSAFLLLAIFPPPVDEGMVASVVRVMQDVRIELGVHAALWVGVAALLFHVERLARRS